MRDDKCYTCGRANPGLWGFGRRLRQLGADFGLVPIVIGGSAVLYVLTLAVSGASVLQMSGLFSILSPNLPALFLFGASGAVPVFRFGRWWTVLSASWLHGGLIHIVFNMYYVRMFGPWMADIIGPSRTVIIYTVAGVSGFLLSSVAGQYLGWLPLPMLRGAGFTVGASAPIFGLLGANGALQAHGQQRRQTAGPQLCDPLPSCSVSSCQRVDSYARRGAAFSVATRPRPFSIP